MLNKKVLVIIIILFSIFSVNVCATSQTTKASDTATITKTQNTTLPVEQENTLDVKLTGAISAGTVIFMLASLSFIMVLIIKSNKNSNDI